MPHHTVAPGEDGAEVRAEVMGDGRWVMVGMPSSHRWVDVGELATDGAIAI